MKDRTNMPKDKIKIKKGGIYSIDNKANGYYEKHLACFFGILRLSVPRDRKGEFYPCILLDRWEKAKEMLKPFHRFLSIINIHKKMI